MDLLLPRLQVNQLHHPLLRVLLKAGQCLSHGLQIFRLNRIYGHLKGSGGVLWRLSFLRGDSVNGFLEEGALVVMGG